MKIKFTSTDISFAYELDAQDPLTPFRDEFVIDDPNQIYLDGNSLGRLPKRTMEIVREAIEEEWGKQLIGVWNRGWVNKPTELGAKIARLVGAQADEILVTESTSTNLFKLCVAALRAQSGRKGIISDVLNFPTDLYILQGVIDFLGSDHQLNLIPSADGMTIQPQVVDSAIDGYTALVCLTHVAFKSAFMYDMAWVTERAHKSGALMLWDLCHSVGAVPVDLNGCDVDLAVGCTYKYLNGGPGSPAFLYVRRDLHTRLFQPIWGWFAARAPFDFELEFDPSNEISRFRVGTPPMLSMLALEPALDLFLKVDMEQVRAKSIQQSEYLIFLTDEWLKPLGFTLGTPRQPEIRGSHVSLRHPEAYRINRALIEAAPPELKVIPDFRAPDNIRLGIAPLYNTFTDIHRALDRMRIIVERKVYEDYSNERTFVT